MYLRNLLKRLGSKSKAVVVLPFLRAEVLHFFLVMVCICKWGGRAELMLNGI